MRTVFADTGYWVALLTPRDQLHAISIALSEALAGSTIITSEMVLAEVLNAFSGAGEFYRMAAARFVMRMCEQNDITIIPQTPGQFAAAFELYLQRPDKEWSLTDCASILICQHEGISEVLAHDHHFAQAGLIPLLQ